MELELIRTYHPNGTNGKLCHKGKLQCYTIELPWRNNAQKISCIPEGKYRIRMRYSIKHKQHLRLEGVSGRDLILVHPANIAEDELKGCIAPVTHITGEGRGSLSRAACKRLTALVLRWIDKEPVYIHIKKEKDDSKTKVGFANTTVL